MTNTDISVANEVWDASEHLPEEMKTPQAAASENENSGSTQNK